MKSIAVIILAFSAQFADLSGQENKESHYKGKDGLYSTEAFASSDVITIRIYYPDAKPNEKTDENVEKPRPIVEGSVGIFILQDGVPILLKQQEQGNVSLMNWTSMGYLRQSVIECSLAKAQQAKRISDIIMIFNESNCIRMTRVQKDGKDQ